MNNNSLDEIGLVITNKIDLAVNDVVSFINFRVDEITNKAYTSLDKLISMLDKKGVENKELKEELNFRFEFLMDTEEKDMSSLGMKHYCDISELESSYKEKLKQLNPLDKDFNDKTDQLISYLDYDIESINEKYFSKVDEKFNMYISQVSQLEKIYEKKISEIKNINSPVKNRTSIGEKMLRNFNDRKSISKKIDMSL